MYGAQSTQLQWMQSRRRWHKHPSWSTLIQRRKLLQTDASCKGLGACLLQDGHPIYFVSKSLTDAEEGYVAIKLEALAVSWACEKFHHFLYGSHFTLQTDQKPLESILARSFNEATPRLQRLLIKQVHMILVSSIFQDQQIKLQIVSVDLDASRTT